jgi:hypothetical protein
MVIGYFNLSTFSSETTLSFINSLSDTLKDPKLALSQMTFKAYFEIMKPLDEMGLVLEKPVKKVDGTHYRIFITDVEMGPLRDPRVLPIDPLERKAYVLAKIEEQLLVEEDPVKKSEMMKEKEEILSGEFKLESLLSMEKTFVEEMNLWKKEVESLVVRSKLAMKLNKIAIELFSHEIGSQEIIPTHIEMAREGIFF